MDTNFLKGQIHIGRPQRSDGREYIEIIVTDQNSKCEAIDIRIDLEDFSRALTSMVSPCEFEYNYSGVIGKKREYKSVEIVVMGGLPYEKDRIRDIMFPLVKKYEVEGWQTDWYTILESRHKMFHDYEKETTTVNVGFRRYV